MDNLEHTYTYKVDSNKEHLAGLKAVKDDLSKQLNGMDWELHKNSTMTHNYTNNTDYDFCAQFYSSNKDKENNIYEKAEEHYECIPSKRTIVLKFYVLIGLTQQDCQNA